MPPFVIQTLLQIACVDPGAALFTHHIMFDVIRRRAGWSFAGFVRHPLIDGLCRRKSTLFVNRYNRLRSQRRVQQITN